MLNRKFCVAPMLDWTDRHCRFFYRLMSQHAVLYTEMVTTGAILHGNQSRHLQFNEEEHPVALQLGGSHPQELAECARIADRYGYDEINLNVGCPSDRVQNGMFGACLMAQPGLVADCVKAMQDAVSIPVTVKSRIGIDDMESYQAFADFIDHVAQSGCRNFIVHARKAWLKGLSPKQNREIPPLRYDYVYQLKQHFPQLEIIINGGISDSTQIDRHLSQVDGVMLGREVYQNPYILSSIDAQLYHADQVSHSRQQVVLELIPYVQKHLAKGGTLNHISRHILGLFHGQKGAKGWRRFISENAHKTGADEQVLLQALKFTE